MVAYADRHVPCEFVAAPDWYYNFEYAEEIDRGYPGHEDLLTTGYFETDIVKGQSVIFSCSTEEVDPATLEKDFMEELARRSNKIDFLSCLRHSARQFIVRHGDKTEVVAGYPWFGRWGRDTFIALPGITLTQGGVESCCEVIDTMVREMKDGMFPNMGSAYNSVDAPLWFFWTLQCLEKHIGGGRKLWKAYGKPMKEILESYMRGGEWVQVRENGLVWAAHPNYAMTWMDAVVDGPPGDGTRGLSSRESTHCGTMPICYTLELARKNKDTDVRRAVGSGCPNVSRSRSSGFSGIEREESFLADYVDEQGQNTIHPAEPDHRLLAAVRYAQRRA